jgi:hypothetical protein
MREAIERHEEKKKQFEQELSEKLTQESLVKKILKED